MKWVAAALLALCASALAPAARADEMKIFTNEISCGGTQFLMELSCPPVNASSPWDCTGMRLHVGAAVSLTAKTAGLPEGHVPVGWLCHREDGVATLLIYGATGGSCDECESNTWIRPSGHVLTEPEIDSNIHILPSDENLVELDRPRYRPEGK